MRRLIKILCLVLLLAGLTLLVLTQTTTPCLQCDTEGKPAVVASSAAQNPAHTNTDSANHTKKLRIFYPGADHEPYIMLNQDGQPGGIIQALLEPFLTEHHYQLVLVNTPRARVVKNLYNGSLDLAMGNPNWHELSNQLHFSRPLFSYTDYIFQHAESGAPPTHWQQLSGKRVCTHLNYQYKKFEQMAATHQITRVPSGSTTLMLRMLLAGRCDYLIGENQIIGHISKREGVSEQIKRSLLSDDKWVTGLSAAPNQGEFIVQLNQYLDSHEYQEHQKKVRERWGVATPPAHY